MKKPSPQIILLEAVENIADSEKRISEAERMVEIFGKLNLVVCVQKLDLRKSMSVGPKSFFSHIRTNQFRFSGKGHSGNDVIMLTHQRESKTGDYYSFLGSRFFIEKISTKDAETYIFLN